MLHGLPIKRGNLHELGVEVVRGEVRAVDGARLIGIDRVDTIIQNLGYDFVVRYT